MDGMIVFMWLEEANFSSPKNRIMQGLGVFAEI